MATDARSCKAHRIFLAVGGNILAVTFPHHQCPPPVQQIHVMLPHVFYRLHTLFFSSWRRLQLWRRPCACTDFSVPERESDDKKETNHNGGDQCPIIQGLSPFAKNRLLPVNGFLTAALLSCWLSAVTLPSSQGHWPKTHGPRLPRLQVPSIPEVVSGTPCRWHTCRQAYSPHAAPVRT